MEVVLRSNRGFDDDDDDDDEAAAALREQREGSSQSQKLGDLSVRVDGKSSCRDQQPSTPRSKHSATEQRRRSKINDRFQILRELIPHSDQKRDKASFLLEVIEYIRFLHEKVQKYESAYPEWNQDNNTRLMPWDKVYYRSIWKNAQNNSQGLGDVVGDPPQVTGNGASPPGFLYSGKPDETSIPVAPLHSSAQNPTESDNMSGGVPYREMENPSAFASKESTMPVCSQQNLCVSVERETGITPTHHTLTLDADNIASQSQSQCLRSSGIDDCTAGSEMLNDQDLTIDEGTISVSTVYSQGLLTTLTQALQSSGVDLSQASISVQISLGKRASSKRSTCITTVSSEKDHDDPSSSNRAIEQSRVGSSGEESEQGPKRQKSDSS